MKKLIVISMFLASCSAYALDAEESTQAAAVADGVSTAAVVAAGAVESNPIVNGVGLLPITALKVAMPYMVRNADPQTRKVALAGGSGVWGGAATANVLLWLVPGIRELRFLVAIPVGIYSAYKTAGKVEKEEQAKLAALKSTEVAAAELSE